MGLSIAYQLGLSGVADRATAFARLEQLRERAQQLPFKLVTDFIEARAGDALGTVPKGGISVEFWFRSWAALTLDAEGGDLVPDAFGFVVIPGDECEPAAFGLAWAPPYTSDWSQRSDEPPAWCWHSVTKTQYASIISADHFVQCHTSIVALLDTAKELGFDVAVFDEGGYWETRDADQLLGHVEHMNQIVAAMAGTLHDKLGEDHPVESPIFQHPDFERLESKLMSPPP